MMPTKRLIPVDAASAKPPRITAAGVSTHAVAESCNQAVGNKCSTSESPLSVSQSANKKKKRKPRVTASPVNFLLCESPASSKGTPTKKHKSKCAIQYSDTENNEDETNEGNEARMARREKTYARSLFDPSFEDEDGEN
jgi:hypothetical protein